MLKRYSRNILLNDFGVDGQKRMLDSNVLIIGIGGVGSYVSTILCGFGVNLTLCDNDKIEESNLNRQFLYSEKDIGISKVKVAVAKLKGYNPHISVKGVYSFTKRSIKSSDVVIDCTDNIESRIKISFLCKQFGKPLVYASAVGYQARVAVFTKKYLHELVINTENFENNNCGSLGVFPPAVALSGSICASECIKLLMGNKSKLENKMFFADVKENIFRVIPF